MISRYFEQVDTDKLRKHDYGDVYDMFFNYLMGSGVAPGALRVLEIGVSRFTEGSGHAFSRLLADHFVGVDNAPLEVPFPYGGIFIKHDAYDKRIFELLAPHAPFHLIIDDGSHLVKDQVFFFRKYDRLCASPAVMVCEDVNNKALRHPAFARLHDMNLKFFKSRAFVDGGDSNMLVRFL